MPHINVASVKSRYFVGYNRQKTGKESTAKCQENNNTNKCIYVQT